MESKPGQVNGKGDLSDFLNLLTPEQRRKLNELAREAREHGYAVLKIIIIQGKGESLRIEKMVR